MSNLHEIQTFCEISPEHTAIWEVESWILDGFQFYKTYFRPKCEFSTYLKLLKDHIGDVEIKVSAKLISKGKNGKGESLKGKEFNRVIIDEFPLDEIDYLRTSGDLVCEECGKKYYAHPFSEHKSYDGHPWLRKLCNGKLIKL